MDLQTIGYNEQISCYKLIFASIYFMLHVMLIWSKPFRNICGSNNNMMFTINGVACSLVVVDGSKSLQNIYTTNIMYLYCLT